MFLFYLFIYIFIFICNEFCHTAIPDEISLRVNVFVLETTSIPHSVQVNRDGTYMLAGKKSHCCRKQK